MIVVRGRDYETQIGDIIQTESGTYKCIGEEILNWIPDEPPTWSIRNVILEKMPPVPPAQHSWVRRLLARFFISA